MNAAALYRSSILQEANLSGSRYQRRRRTFVAIDWAHYKVECEAQRHGSATSKQSEAHDLEKDVEYNQDRLNRVHHMDASVSKFTFRNPNVIILFLFTFGSLSFLGNGFFSILPLTIPELNFSGEAELAAPLTNVFGAILFSIGSVLVFPTVWNTQNQLDVLKQHDLHEDKPLQMLIGRYSWRWLPTRHQLRLVCKELPFQSTVIQILGVGILLPSSFVGFPGVLDPDDVTGLSVGVFGPLLLGGSLFFLSNVMLLIFTEDETFIKKILSIAWYSSLLNAVGSLSFALAGASLLMAEITWGTLLPFAGAWAFLGSVLLQWFDFVLS